MIINYKQALMELERIANKFGASLEVKREKNKTGWIAIIADREYGEKYYSGSGTTMALAIFDCYYNTLQERRK